MRLLTAAGYEKRSSAVPFFAIRTDNLAAELEATQITLADRMIHLLESKWEVTPACRHAISQIEWAPVAWHDWHSQLLPEFTVRSPVRQFACVDNFQAQAYVMIRSLRQST